MHVRRSLLIASLPTATLFALAACGSDATAPARDVAPRAAIIMPPSDSIVITSVTVPSDPQPIQDGGSTVDVTATYTGGSPSTTVTLDCGGGVASDEYASGGSASGSCTYTEPGVHTVTFTLVDGGTTVSQSASTYVVVYDPGTGFVTGGGWIVTPAGSYAANPALSGRANFGFVSKYLKGASIPTGQTEFQFQLGSIDFHSTSYQWLVVSNGRAQYRGEGTINRQSGYGFQVTAIDGRLAGTAKDEFRIQIWDRNNGNAVVYDTQFGQDDSPDNALPLSGGSISIKK